MEADEQQHLKLISGMAEPDVDDMLRSIRHTVFENTNRTTNKRPAPGVQPAAKKQKVGIPKSPLMVLNEIAPGSDIRVLELGGKLPQFEAMLEVSGQVFRAVASSKKQAKQQVANQALESGLIRIPRPQMIAPLKNNSGPIEFTPATELTLGYKSFETPENAPNGAVKPEMQTSGGTRLLPACNSATNTSVRELTSEKRTALEAKHSAMVLNELHPNAHPELCEEIGQNQDKLFKFQVVIDGKTFEATGRSKKTAKARVAAVALHSLYNLNFNLEGVGTSGFSGKTVDLNHTLADRISALVYGKYTEICAALDQQHRRRKVLAGVVMTTDPEMLQCKLICVTTGTKTVSGEFLSPTGAVINDCHAEVLARRALVRFLVAQLNSCTAQKQDAESLASRMFKRTADGCFVLAENVRFHMFISSAPCGDGRVFAPHETSIQTDNHPNRKARARLRTKIESGEGTVLIPDDGVIQTWDGVLIGNRLLTMSCSDKLLLWNVIGLQGSLLTSVLTAPIYLYSLSLGSLCHAEHVQRAVYGRASNLQDLPNGYRVAQPSLAATSSPEQRQPAGKAPGYAVVWSCVDQKVEVINISKGLIAEQQAEGSSQVSSSLCKRRMYEDFMTLLQKLDRSIDGSDYRDHKLACVSYREAKNKLQQFLMESGLGKWVRKPAEQDMFTL